MKRQAGFTLIELLVVVGIIGILLSLSLASISHARVRSRDAKRIADLRSIQSALEQHTLGDASHSYPPEAPVSTYCPGSNSAYGIYNNPCFSAYMSVVPVDPRGVQYTYHRPACLLAKGAASVTTTVMNTGTDSASCVGAGGVYNSSYGLHAALESDNISEAKTDNSPTDGSSYDLMP